MKANCWYGKHKLEVKEVPDPKVLNPRDAIVKITLTAICGSDLHLYDGYIPSMRHGDIMGHEFMGEVVELGSAVHNLKIGDRVVVSVYHFVRELFFLRVEDVCGMREFEPECMDGGEALGALTLWHLRVLAFSGRVCGRTGPVRAGSVRGCRADQSAGGVKRRTSVVPFRHSSKRLIWQRRTATSMAEIRLPFGAVVRWDCWPLRVLIC